MLSNTLYGDLTAISVPKMWPMGQRLIQRGHIIEKRRQPHLPRVVLSHIERLCRVEGCTDVQLSSHPVRFLTIAYDGNVGGPRATREVSHPGPVALTTCCGLAPHERLV